MQKPNVNKEVISPYDHMGFLINAQIRGLIDLAYFHRKTHWHAFQDVYQRDKDRGNASKFFRDFCTVQLVLPQRAGLSTWCQRNLEPKDLYVSRVNWDSRSFNCKVSTWDLSQVDTDNPPDLIVLDSASLESDSRVQLAYDKLAKDPERQLFLLLG